jgi:hypothetical protein
MTLVVCCGQLFLVLQIIVLYGINNNYNTKKIKKKMRGDSRFSLALSEDDRDQGLIHRSMIGSKGRLMGRGSANLLTTQESALLAQAAYKYGDTYGTEDDRARDTDAMVAPLGFKLARNFSGRQMSVFKKRKPDGSFWIHIAHKGTQPKNLAGIRDIISDMRIATGTAMWDSQFQERLRNSERAVMHFNPTTLTMSGHSLGGATMNDTVVRSKLLRQRVNQADSFDAGASPFFSNTTSALLGKKDKEHLNDVLTHHRMRHDLVSKGLLYAKPPGDVKTYKLSAADGEEWKNQDGDLKDSTESTANSNAPLLTKQQIKNMGLVNRTLYAHGMDQFTNRNNIEIAHEITGRGMANRKRKYQDALLK